MATNKTPRPYRPSESGASSPAPVAGKMAAVEPNIDDSLLRKINKVADSKAGAGLRPLTTDPSTPPWSGLDNTSEKRAYNVDMTAEVRERLEYLKKINHRAAHRILMDIAIPMIIKVSDEEFKKRSSKE